MTYTSAVPMPVWNPATGFIVPTEQAILAGVRSDQNVAFGGNLNPALTTPQGQLATSETAIIEEANTTFLNLINQVDPAYASGRMQDALGRFYQLARIPATSTVVSANCNGLPGTVIGIGSFAQDQGGNTYNANQTGVIPTPAQFTASAGATFTGSIAGTVLTVSSTSAGVIALGQTLTGAGVAAGTVIIAGSLLSWTVNNSQAVGPITFTASGTTLTISAIASGVLAAGQLLAGGSVPANTYLTGGAGLTWTTNNPINCNATALTSSGVVVTFACALTGPIAAPTGFLNSIYQAVPGWDTIYNWAAGAVGNDVENRAAFEVRRLASIALNSSGAYVSVLGNVLAVPDVLDAYVLGNPLDVMSGAAFAGSITDRTLTVNATSVSGTIAIGQVISDGGVNIVLGTYIIGGSGVTWTLNQAYAIPVGSEAMTSAQGGVRLAAHSIYVGVYGGDALAVATAIFRKMSPGCNFNGNTTVNVQDTQFPYSPPYPTYAITSNTLTPLPISFLVTMINNANVPANATQLIQQAILATFAGQVPGVNPARTGAFILHSQYYAAIFALGTWVQISEVLVGTGTANQSSILIPIDREPTLQASNINVVFVAA